MNPLLRDAALGAPDPALASLFMVIVPGAVSSTSLIVESVTATFGKTPAEARFNNGSNTYYPGVSDIDGLSIAFFENSSRDVSKWYKQWRSLVFDETDGTYGAPAIFKKDIIVNQYKQGQSAPIRVNRYSGCWPTDKEPFAFSYEDPAGRLQLNAQFSVDSMTVE